MSRSSTIFTVRGMVMTALFTAVLCVAAPFSVSIGPIPLSFATFVIYLAAASLGWKYGVMSVILYVLLGAAGLPVFANFEGGFHKITGYSGGFIIGYIPCALAIGLFIDIFGNKLYSYIIGMAAGTIVLYACGTIWFIAVTGNSLPAALMMTAVPFLPGDTAKIIAACITAPQLRAALNRQAASK